MPQILMIKPITENRGKQRETFGGTHNPRVFGSSPNGPIDKPFKGNDLPERSADGALVFNRKSAGVPKLSPSPAECSCVE